MSGTAVAGRIGPNAVIRLAEALDACEGRAVTAKLFRTAGLEHYVGAPPQSMVAEDEVTVLHRHLREALPSGRARTVSWIAGQRTAEYLLANRVPQPMQRLLKILPRRVSAFILLTAIGKHAWTFAEHSRITVASAPPREVCGQAAGNNSNGFLSGKTRRQRCCWHW